MAITVVQFAKAQSSGGTSINVAFPSNVTAGNLIVVAAGNNNNANGGFFSINDAALGNTYTKAVDLLLGPPFWYTAIYYAQNINGGSCTVSISNGGNGAGNLQGYVYEISGLDTVTPLDQIGSSSAGSSVSTVGSTANANEYVFAFIYDATSADVTLSPGTGYTDGQFQRDGAQNAAGISEDAIVSSTGVQTATMSVAGTALMLIATFQAPGSGPTVDQLAPTFDDGMPDGGPFVMQAYWVTDTDPEGLEWFPFPIIPPPPGPLAPAADQIVSRIRAAMRKPALMQSASDGYDWTQFIVLPAWNPALGNSQDTDGDWQKPSETPSTANIQSDAGADWTRFIILPRFEAWTDDDANLASILMMQPGAVAFWVQEELIEPPNVQPTGPASGRSGRLGFVFPSFR